MNTRRTFTTQQKLSILKQAAEQGVTNTLKKYGVFPSVYYKWKTKFTQMGEQGLKHGMTPAHLRRIRALEKENKMLKELVAEERLAGKLKDELLKKKWALAQKNKR